MTLVSIQEVRDACARFVATATTATATATATATSSSPDELAVELNRVHSLLSTAVPSRFLELSRHELQRLEVTPALSMLTGHVSAVAQLDGFSSALSAVLSSNDDSIVHSAVELIALMVNTLHVMQPASRDSPYLTQHLLVDASMVLALIDLLALTKSNDTLSLVCMALSDALRTSPSIYNTALAHGIVTKVMTRIRKTKADSSVPLPHLSMLLATIVFLSSYQPSWLALSHPVLLSFGSIDGDDHQFSPANSNRLRRSFGDVAVKFCSAVPYFADYIDDIEQHFKECILSPSGDDYETLIPLAAGFIGMTGLVRNGIPLAVFSNVDVVAHIRSQLSSGMPEAIVLLETVMNSGSMAAKNVIKSVFPDAQLAVTNVAEALSNLSAANLVSVAAHLDMIARLYRFDTSLRNTVVNSTLPDLLIQLLNDTTSNLFVRIAATHTLIAVARSTLSPPSDDILSRIIICLVNVVRRFDHVGLVRCVIEGLCDLKHTSTELSRLCSRNPVHVVLLERVDQLYREAGQDAALEQTLAMLANLTDWDEFAAVDIARHPDLVDRLCRLSGDAARPSLAASALHLWRRLLVKELTVLSLAEKGFILTSCIMLAARTDITVNDAATALEVLYMIYGDLTIADCRRIVNLCHTLLHGDCHIALLRPVGILLEAVLQTLSLDDSMRIEAVADIASALHLSATWSMNKRALIILSHRPAAYNQHDNSSSLATIDIFRALRSFIISLCNQSTDAAGFSIGIMLLCDAVHVATKYRFTMAKDITCEFKQLQLGGILADIITSDVHSSHIRARALQAFVDLLESGWIIPLQCSPSQLPVEQLMMQLTSQMDKMDPYLIELTSKLAIYVLRNNASDSVKLELRKICSQSCDCLIGGDVSSLSALLCVVSILAYCDSYCDGDVLQILTALTGVVRAIAISVDSHPCRALLAKCLESLDQAFSRLSHGVYIPCHEDLMNAVLTVTCHNGVSECVLKPAIRCLRRLALAISRNNVGTFALRFQTELESHLASNNKDVSDRILFALMVDSDGRPSTMNSWLSDSNLFKRTIQRLECSIFDETLPLFVDAYSTIIKRNLTRLSPYGLIETLAHAACHRNFMVCTAALDMLASICESRLKHRSAVMKPYSTHVLAAIRVIMSEPHTSLCTKMSALNVYELYVYPLATTSRTSQRHLDRVSSKWKHWAKMHTVLMRFVDELPSVHLALPFIKVIFADRSHLYLPASMASQMDTARQWLVRFITERCFGLHGVDTTATAATTATAICLRDHALRLCGLRSLHILIFSGTFRALNSSYIPCPAMTQYLLDAAQDDSSPSILRVMSLDALFGITQNFRQNIPEQSGGHYCQQEVLVRLADTVFNLSCIDPNGNVNISTITHSLLIRARVIRCDILQWRITARLNGRMTASASAIIDEYCSMLAATITWLKQGTASLAHSSILSSLLDVASPNVINHLINELYSTENVEVTAEPFQYITRLRDVLAAAYAVSFDCIQRSTWPAHKHAVFSAFYVLCSTSGVNGDGGTILKYFPHIDFCFGFIRQHSQLICRLLESNYDADIVINLADHMESSTDFKEYLVDTGILRAYIDGILHSVEWFVGNHWSFQSLCNLMVLPQFVTLDCIWQQYVVDFTAILTSAFEQAVENFKAQLLRNKYRQRGNRPASQVYMDGTIAGLVQLVSPVRGRGGGNIEVYKRYRNLMQQVSRVDGTHGRIRSALEECLTHGPTDRSQHQQLRNMLDQYFGGCRYDLSLEDLPRVKPDSNSY
ncbi:hypothetical protein GQ42DRAFT_68355 [Ramicandelaber brevisporus]|nr:hypothetical protein GQ42DRAFT_68355 [Ramicandelaber brevisporus]